MTGELFSTDVRNFLIECIDSVAQLEALLLLRGSPERSWEVSEIAARLFISEKDAGHILSSLIACELAETDGSAFKYHIRDAQHQELVDRVAQSYSRYLVPVTRLIHDKSGSIRRFAEAFKLRRDE